MEKKSMGTFLAALRKANGLTQQEVADKLNVSNKTISKWECDDGCPEIMTLPAIAELYNITVDELLRGERNGNKAETAPNTKSVERLKLTIGKTMLKFKNATIICYVIMALAFILLDCLLYITNDFHDHEFFAVIISVLLSLTALIVQIVFTNNTLFQIRTDGIEVSGFTITGELKTIYKQLSSIIFLFIICSFENIISIIDEDLTILALPVVCMITYILYKPFSRPLKKHICGYVEPPVQVVPTKVKKNLFLFTCVILILSFAMPFIQSAVAAHTQENYYFHSADEYEKCKKLYSEHKGYQYIDEGESTPGNYYILVASLYSNDEYLSLDYKTKNEKNSLISKSVIMNEDIPPLLGECKFDDKKLSVSYDKLNPDISTGAFDILPVYLLLGPIVDILVIATVFVIYHAKAKKIANSYKP